MLDNREHYDEFIAADLGEQDTDEFFERLQVPGALGGEWGAKAPSQHFPTRLALASDFWIFTKETFEKL